MTVVCECRCPEHPRGVCAGAPATDITLAGKGTYAHLLTPRPARMCPPCARWWCTNRPDRVTDAVAATGRRYIVFLVTAAAGDGWQHWPNPWVDADKEMQAMAELPVIGYPTFAVRAGRFVVDDTGAAAAVFHINTPAPVPGCERSTGWPTTTKQVTP